MTEWKGAYISEQLVFSARSSPPYATQFKS
ncbi:hypothetical protein HNQ55_003425 [Thalassotalea piscium]|uniref:Uncharacterized protein n=1 Tax=Thalassotalea piscium TaxID=1230533 RepID=A0A7X0TV23_9GAMM|nr:hypothetical protein [Thalassotalea piscium]